MHDAQTRSDYSQVIPVVSQSCQKSLSVVCCNEFLNWLLGCIESGTAKLPRTLPQLDVWNYCT